MTPPGTAAAGPRRELVVFTDQTETDQGPAKALLAEAGLDSVSLELGPGAQVPAACREAVGAVVGYARIDRPLLAQLPRLAVLATISTGTDMIDSKAASDLGIDVVPLVGASTEEVAGHTAALALSAVRGLERGAAVVRSGGWTADLDWAPPPLSAMTLGLVGLGRIGRQVAEWLGPMFGRVLACDPLAAATLAGAPLDLTAAGASNRTAGAPPAGAPLAGATLAGATLAGAPLALTASGASNRTAGAPPAGVSFVHLPELIRRADLISLHLPLAPGAGRLLGAAEFAAMKPGVILVNTARGGLVDGAALAAALRSGQVAAYAADVLEAEPPDPADPLLAAPNALITPHMAYLSTESTRRYELWPARNLVAALRKKGVIGP